MRCVACDTAAVAAATGLSRAPVPSEVQARARADPGYGRCYIRWDSYSECSRTLDPTTLAPAIHSSIAPPRGADAMLWHSTEAHAPADPSSAPPRSEGVIHPTSPRVCVAPDTRHQVVCPARCLTLDGLKNLTSAWTEEGTRSGGPRSCVGDHCITLAFSCTFRRGQHAQGR